MSGKLMRKQRFTGIEPWTDFWNKKMYESNYVTVLTVHDYAPIKREVIPGKWVTITPVSFVYTVNFSGFETNEKASTLRTQEVVLEVEGTFDDEIDGKRVKRQFEIDANAFLHKTKAKKPDFQTKFAKIDMSKIRWKRWFPTKSTN
jgi:hypothetical protein